MPPIVARSSTTPGRITNDLSRRDAIKAGLHVSLGLTLGLGALPVLTGCGTHDRTNAGPEDSSRSAPWFQISLAQWSLHRSLQSGTLAHLDFPRKARDDFGIHAVEYVNSFFAKPYSAAEPRELRRRCDDLGVQSLLIMCDGEGNLGDPDDAARTKAIDNHRKWLDAAVILGCHSIRVNAASKGTPEEQSRLAADGLRRLCEHADPLGLDVIVENHGGLSSRGDWLAGVMRRVDHSRIGTLPDFGNFGEYDRYQGVRELLPFARGVSAKSYDFDPATGAHPSIDYLRMLRIVHESSYRGFIGIEYEGSSHGEDDGIRLTKSLLERVRSEIAPEAIR